VCLTGSVQIGYCWLALFEATGEPSYREAAFAVNRYVRRSLRMNDDANTRGAVQGSFPIDGSYSRYEYPNWAAKFLIDALVMEARIRAIPASRAADG
jgi:hypothetical protein